MANEDPTREKTRQFLAGALSAGGDASADESIQETASSIEHCIFIKNGSQVDEPYRNQARQLGLTLKKDNPQLKQAVVERKLDPKDLVNMSQEELASPSTRAQDSALEAENLKNSVGVDSLIPRASDENDPEGEFHGRRQPKIKTVGMEFETGDS